MNPYRKSKVLNSTVVGPSIVMSRHVSKASPFAIHCGKRRILDLGGSHSDYTFLYSTSINDINDLNDTPRTSFALDHERMHKLSALHDSSSNGPICQYQGAHDAGVDYASSGVTGPARVGGDDIRGKIGG